VTTPFARSYRGREITEPTQCEEGWQVAEGKAKREARKEGSKKGLPLRLIPAISPEIRGEQRVGDL
jgi:hypothetical protein